MPLVLITGANRGIGLEFARQYAADGWEVFASCRNPKTAKDLASLVKRSGGKLTVVQMDVTDGQSVRNAARQLGKKAIDPPSVFSASEPMPLVSVTIRRRSLRAM